MTSVHSAPRNSQISRGWLLACALALVAGSLAHFAFGYFHAGDQSGNAWGADDAYISYRYARNLAAGLGPVFNADERVEGYSNPLHVVLLWLGFEAGIADPDILTFATALNVGFAVGALLLFYSIASGPLEPKFALIATGLFAAAPTIWANVGAGMETPLVLLLQLALLRSIVRLGEAVTRREAVIACIASGLLVLTRADGFVTPGIGVLYLLLRRSTKAAAVVFTSTAVSLALISAWRLGYYGNLLPNTYYAKVSGLLAQRFRQALFQLAGISVFQGYLLYLTGILHGAARLLYRRGWRMPANQVPVTAMSCFSLGWLGYWLYIGGDIYADRFLLILIPIGLLSLTQLVASSPARGAWVLLPIVLAFQILPLWMDPRFDYATHKYDRGVQLGIFLGERHEHQLLAVDAAGKVPYYSSLATIDMLGLNDAQLSQAAADPRYLGHGKFDPDYVLQRRPDLIAAWMAPCTDSGCDRLDLILGLSEETYRRAGYQLRYLVNSTPVSTGRDIVTVASWERSAILDLIFQGYGYGVLLRNGQPGYSP